MSIFRQRFWNHGFTAICVAFGLGCLALAAARLQWSAVADALASARLYPWLILAVGSYLAGQLLRGARCKALVSQDTRLTLPSAANIVAAGYAVNNLLPGRLGEFARAGMLKERGGLPYPHALTVIGIERMLDGLILAFLALLASGLLPTVRGHLISLWSVMGLFLCLSGAVAFLVLCPTFFLTRVSGLTSRLPAAFHQRSIALVQSMNNALSSLRSGPRVFHLGVMSAMIWIVESLMFLFLLPSFGLPADPAVALMAMSFTNLILLIPSTPGFIGPFHLACTEALVLTGVDRSVAFGYATLVHLAFYVPVTLWGVGILLTSSLALNETLALRRQAVTLHPYPTGPDQPSETAPPKPHLTLRSAPSRFMSSVIEALLPFDRLTLDHADRAVVLTSCAGFVELQVRSLPPRLRALLSLGLAGFRFITLVVYRRSFPHIPLVARRKWVMHWAYGNVPLTRQLFKVLRSNAFLAFFEEPAVVQGLKVPQRGALDPSAPVLDPEGESK